VEPTEDGGRVRFRVDRTLREVQAFSRDDFQSLVSVLKHSANLKIDVTREFQDGSFSQATPNGRKVDSRLSAMPVHSGEKLVLRLWAPTRRCVRSIGSACRQASWSGTWSPCQSVRRAYRMRTDRYGQDDDRVRDPRTR